MALSRAGYTPRGGVSLHRLVHKGEDVAAHWNECQAAGLKVSAIRKKTL